MKQKVVINVSMNNAKSRTRALKTAVSAPGVISAAIQGDDRSQIVVTGEGIDSTYLTMLLRKKFGFTEVVSITPIPEKKDENETKFEAQPIIPTPYQYDTPQIYSSVAPESSEIAGVEDVSETNYDDYTTTREIEFGSLDMFETMRKTNRMSWKCLLFCYLFPQNYEFHKDDIIQLWTAQEFVAFLPHEEILRKMAVTFEEFKEKHIFLSRPLDYSTGQPRYKLHNSIFHLLQQQRYSTYFRADDVKSNISESTMHSSVNGIDPITLQELYQAKTLCTLLIHGSHIDQLPRELFIKLPLLRVLDLSHTGIKELPSSIGNLKDLRYLNLSGTPITTLPNSLCSLYEMKTLTLRGCLKLVGLPKEMGKLIELRHLDVDIACLMVSMPPGFGDLTQLQTLPAFVVGKEKGCHITELRHMVNLRGTLRILRLENVSNCVEAMNAAVNQKKYIYKLELQWTEVQDGFDFEVLENLQPHTQLKELQIIGFAGFVFPSWIGDPRFSNLVTITLHDCRHCRFLPPLGKLPSLKCLSLSDIHAVKAIDGHFCGRDMVTGLLDFGRFVLKAVAPRSGPDNIFKAFPRLENLTLDGMPMLQKWSGLKKGDFHDLHKLNISGCSKLRALPKLVLFESLQQLEISLCPLLESFPNEGLPTSLQYLIIIDCPLIKEWCHNKARSGGMIAHVLNVWIDYQQISPILSTRQDEDGETSDETNLLDTEVSNSESNLTIKQSVFQTRDQKDEQEGEEELVTPGKKTMQPNKKEMNLGKTSKGANHKYISNDGKDLSFDFSGELLSTFVPPSPRSEGKIFQSSNLKSFSFAELEKATQNFRSDCVLGEGHFGSVFKGWIDEDMLSATKPGKGISVAVRRFNQESIQGSREWFARILYVGKFYHRNLVQLVGYCIEHKHLLLVYEFMPRGSLENNLFGKGDYQPLSWTHRMNVALGVARGLAFLHINEKLVVYRDLKASNILLDSDYNAKLDFGLVMDEHAPMGDGDGLHVTTKVLLGTYEYAAPEYLATGQLSSKGNVYGFGVVLLEMLCGRRALDKNRPSGEHNLVEWAKPYLSDRRKVFCVLDNRLEGQYPMEGVQKAAQLALGCLSMEPKSRPKMDKVVKALEEVQDSKDAQNE